MTKKLPLLIRDVKPHPDAVRLTGKHNNGLPDGVHTGGAWLHDDKVYKPLDGRPYVNADFHLPTAEAECLTALIDMPFFPKNWNVETINGREFLVRNKSYIWGRDNETTRLDREQALQVEQAVRNANRRGWEICDYITIGLDPVRGKLLGYEHAYFIVDLSNAHKIDAPYRADDYHNINMFFRLHGWSQLAELRANAAETISTTRLKKYAVNEPLTNQHRHIYASFNRPIDSLWASIPDAVYVHTNNANWSTMTPHTWVIVPCELDDETISRYELTWGWSPIHATENVPA